MALATAIKKVETARKAYEKTVAKVGRKSIAAELAKLIPDGFVLAWNQYTPGFNDGDPCVFSVGEVRLMTENEVTDGVGEVGRDENDQPIENDVTTIGDQPRVDFDIDDEGTLGIEYGELDGLKWAGVTTKEVAALRKAWNLIAKRRDVLEHAFGNGSQIVIRSNGKYSVDEYECGY